MLDGAGVPGRSDICPGKECCGWLADSDDPCRGCGLRGSDREGGGLAANYALFLADFIETFSPSAAEIGWRDYEVCRVCLQAKQEHLADIQRKTFQFQPGQPGRANRRV